ncbi:MAG: hypothetical protein ACI9HY_004254, partial [Planctomycetaceae bacterium]
MPLRPLAFKAFNRYSRWDGSQLPELDADRIMEALSDDLMEFGDLEQAMRYLMQRGLSGEEGSQIQGIRDMLKRLKDQRNQRLERYDMSSVLEDIRRQLDQILSLERATIKDWQNQQNASDASDRFMNNLMNDLNSKAVDDAAPRSSQPEDSDTDRKADTAAFSNKVLGDIGTNNQAFLDNLPPDPAGKVRALENYEFLNTEAQKKFLKLLADLRKSMTQSYFKDVQDMVKNMSAGDVYRMKQMVKDLNEMLVKKIAGEDPGFKDFMQKYGDMFGDNPPKSL